MRIHKFESTSAFVAIDLDEAEVSSGPVRLASKVLQGGAKDLARSQSYTYAVLGMRRSGASAGISADGPDQADAIGAFVAEVGSIVADHIYLPDAAKGVSHHHLAPLAQTDPRNIARLGEFADRCDGLSAVITAHGSVGGLEGRTVAIEGFGANSTAIAEAVAERCGRIIAVSTTTGTVVSEVGFEVSVLAESWGSHSADMVGDLGTVTPGQAIFDSGADVIFVGSKMGVIDHGVAMRLRDAAAVVPSGRLPITARALAVLRRSGVVAPADFVTLAGSTIAAWDDADSSDDQVRATIEGTIGDLTAQFQEHPDGPFLAACFAAEAFMSTWQDKLPFGRPLAP